MIMLIEAVQVPKRGLLKKQAIFVDNQIILGMKVMVMAVPIPAKLFKWQESRLKRRVYELLGRLRINTICLKADFPYPEWFKGYRSLEGKELIKRFLGKITVKSADKYDAVYVCLNRCDRNSFNAIIDLCQSFRHIMLSGKNVDIADRLYKTYGASVIVDPTADRIMKADAAVFFDEPSEMPDFNENCVIIKADDSLTVEFALTSGEEFDIPDGYPQISLISEAILRGCIGFEDIYIAKSEISP